MGSLARKLFVGPLRGSEFGVACLGLYIAGPSRYVNIWSLEFGWAIATAALHVFTWLLMVWVTSTRLATIGRSRWWAGLLPVPLLAVVTTAQFWVRESALFVLGAVYVGILIALMREPQHVAHGR